MGRLIHMPDARGRRPWLLAAVYFDIAELKPYIHIENAIPHIGRTSCSIPIP